MQCFPTWCCTSGDILDTFSRFTFRLLTSVVDFKASLASVREKIDKNLIDLDFFSYIFSGQASSQFLPAAFSF